MGLMNCSEGEKGMKTVLKTLNKYKYLLQQLVLKDIKLK